MSPENRRETGIAKIGRETRFRPGQSGNPGGRPSTKLLTDELKRRLAMRAPEAVATDLGLQNDATVAEAIAARLVCRAMIGDVNATREILDRLEGKVRKVTEFSHDEEVVIRVVYDDALPKK